MHASSMQRPAWSVRNSLLVIVFLSMRMLMSFDLNASVISLSCASLNGGKFSSATTGAAMSSDQQNIHQQNIHLQHQLLLQLAQPQPVLRSNVFFFRVCIFDIFGKATMSKNCNNFNYLILINKLYHVQHRRIYFSSS